MYEAEQASAAEKRKLQELQREIEHERNFEELKKIGQKSGVLAADDSKRLEWMYKGAENTLNREEYLTGRAIDKHFEQHEKNERQKEAAKLVGITEPINHVEHECIPFSIRAFRGAPAVSIAFNIHITISIIEIESKYNLFFFYPTERRPS